MEMKEPLYKGRGVRGSHQRIPSATGTMGLAVDLTIHDLGDVVMTTQFWITAASWPFISERLRVMGWKGNDVGDLTSAQLEHLGDNEVTVRVYPDKYKDQKDGKEKVNWKCEVMTRAAGRITYENTIDEATWLARVKAAVGNASGGGGGVAATDEPPPF
jgi:hypothetical protein